MPLLPDYGRMIFSEENVNVPAGLKPRAAYDLVLYQELGNAKRGVLVVKFIGNFEFKDGKKADGTVLAWTNAEKTNFMNGFRSTVRSVWAEKHRIKATSPATPIIRDVGVVFDIQTAESMIPLSHSHWNIAVMKVDQFSASAVEDGGGGLFSNGAAYLDSEDTTRRPMGGPWAQRGCVHEFGHMMGYRDEYPNAVGRAEDNPNWLADLGSVMSWGETVRPRHYVFFAHWLTEQSRRKHGPLVDFAGYAVGQANWKVNGSVDLSNAQI